MFQLLKNPDFDFMARRKILLFVSLALVILAVLVIAVRGINKGIEFTGGTELQLKFADRPDIGAIRDALRDAGMSSQSVTTIGEPGEYEVYIRLASEVEGEDHGDIAAEAREALRTRIFNEDMSRADLNIDDETTLRGLLANVPSLSETEAATLARTISERRKEVAIFKSIDDLSSIAGMTPEVLDYLRANTNIGPLAARGQSYIGPAIGRELMQKALFAIIGSLVGMLVYIWIRFELQWGLAAVVALAHDTLLTLGLFALFQKEMSLPVVAAFLTLVGYSVNDTVVVFDRIRENLRNRRGVELIEVVNLSINQTLSRTIITSGLTWVVVMGLFLFGGAALNPFAFVLAVGVVVGTYSSIYIASPFLVLWSQFVDGRRKSSGLGGSTVRAKKVRTS